MGARKSPNNVVSTFLNAADLLPKDLRFEHGAPICFLPRAPSNLATLLNVGKVGSIKRKLEENLRDLRSLLTALQRKGVRKGWGVGLKSPLDLDILQKNYYLRKGD